MDNNIVGHFDESAAHRRNRLEHCWNNIFWNCVNIKTYVRSQNAILSVTVEDAEIIESFVELAEILVAESRLSTSQTTNNKMQSNISATKPAVVLWQPGVCIEYFLHNNIFQMLVDFAVENVPRGILPLTAGLIAALASALPPAFFLDSAVHRPMTLLLKHLLRSRPSWSVVSFATDGAIPSQIEQNFPEIILTMLTALCEQIISYPPLLAVFLTQESRQDNNNNTIQSSSCPLIDLLIVTLQSLAGPDVNQEATKYVHFAQQYLVNLLQLKGDYQQIVEAYLATHSDFCLIVVMTMVARYANLPRCIDEQEMDEASDELVQWFCFVDRCLTTSSTAELATVLVSLFKSCFIRNVFISTIRDCGLTDGSLDTQLRLVVRIITAVKGPDLILPLFIALAKEIGLITETELERGRKNETNERMIKEPSLARRLLPSSSNEKPLPETASILTLLTAIINNDSLLTVFGCTAPKVSLDEKVMGESTEKKDNISIIRTNETIQTIGMHRRHCQSYLTLLGFFSREIIEERSSLSALYKLHLGQADLTIPTNYRIIHLTNTSNNEQSLFSLIKQTPILQMALSTAIGALGHFWQNPPKLNLALGEFMTNILTAGDSELFHTIFDETTVGKALCLEGGTLFRTMQTLTDAFINDGPIASLLAAPTTRAHLSHILSSLQPDVDPFQTCTNLIGKVGFLDPATAPGAAMNIALLANFLLRWVACCQVYATRSYTVIMY